MSKPSILCVIPARGGSKGVPRKNIRPIAGRPLIDYTIKAALGSGMIDHVVVSTEDEEIAAVAVQCGAETVKRPMELAVDTALTEPVLMHALETMEASGFKPDFIALIQPTSPFLTSEVIKQAIDKVVNGDFDSCITVFLPHGHEFKWRKNEETGQFIPEHDVEHRPRRQDLPKVYHENGAFYITRTELFKQTKNRFGGTVAKVTAVEMSEIDSLQIDNFHDLWLTEKLIEKRVQESTTTGSTTV